MFISSAVGVGARATVISGFMYFYKAIGSLSALIKFLN
jgi:hypothetical protein